MEFLSFKSGGNGGNFMKKLPKGKLYHGSDSLLSVVVGAINDERYASNYSRVGLGPKGTIKPDVASYGGELSLGDGGKMVMNGVKSFLEMEYCFIIWNKFCNSKNFITCYNNLSKYL